MSDQPCCPFCGEPAEYASVTYLRFRCGTHGPDIDGDYDVGHTCYLITFTRLLRDKDAEIERRTKQLKSWVPMPWDISGWDDPDCPDDVKELIREACEIHRVAVPERMKKKEVLSE